MLNPASNRCDYGQLLCPPAPVDAGGEVFELDAAIATTYSLDLNALLVLPVSLVLGNTLDGDLAGEKLPLLDAISRLGDRLKVFYQRGNIHVPLQFNRLFGLLEPMLVPIVPAEGERERSAAFSSFHPKLWLLRYVRRDRRGAKTLDSVRKYRLLVMSRNLTFDRSWDITATLDGELSDDPAREYDALADFITSLESHAPDFQPMKSMIRDLPRVQWKTPQPFRDPRMLPGGGAHIKKAAERFKSPLNFGGAVDELLVVSPFLDTSDKKALNWLGERVTGPRYLFSRSETLNALGARALSGWNCYALNERIVSGEERQEEDNARTQDLHAKLIVSRSGQTAHWHLGSANATLAALGESLDDVPRNTEFMLRLSGAHSKVGIETLLRQWTGEASNHFAVLHEFEPLDTGEQDADRQQLRILVHRLIAARWKLIAHAGDDDRYRLVLSTSFVDGLNAPDSVAQFEVKVGLLSGPGGWRALQGAIEWSGLRLTDLSALLPVQISDHAGKVRQTLVVQADLVLPSGVNRTDAVIRELVDTQEKFLGYVRMLLDPTPDKRKLLGRDGHGGEVSDLFGFDGNQAMFEQLMLAAARNPGHLLRVEQLVRRLDKLNVVVPKDFSALWKHFEHVAKDSR
ncbi:hypothetical protein PanNE5_14030 [Pandoraea sp. NE5]|uniref:phospholipase D family protein n=1 Tax=Pandoraea sp. NE5 TaxID=2904129 RepID=UPI0021C4580A|nr:phospholipase D family protein [Pandoraea sp. NE5]BDD91963.1 hypothetical protein PanNE5_14030 [Pandoraea sp. NE5]